MALILSATIRRSSYFIHREDSGVGVSTQAARWCSGRDLNPVRHEGRVKFAGTALSKVSSSWTNGGIAQLVERLVRNEYLRNTPKLSHALCSAPLEGNPATTGSLTLSETL